MIRKSPHTHIMLDLECANTNSFKPVIMEIGAVNFNIDTGEELSSFSTFINFESCVEKGLETNPETMRFLRGDKTLAATLEQSRASPVTIVEALINFTNWIRECEFNNPRMEPRPEVLVWGNGSAADNVWIKSAYRACGMGNKIPWMYYGDRCVRTILQECFDVTGRNYRREEKRVGSFHVAVDDCRHQVKYLVKARNELAGRGAEQGRQGRTGLVLPETSPPRVNESARNELQRRSMQHVPQSVKGGFTSPQNSFPGQEMSSEKGGNGRVVQQEEQQPPTRMELASPQRSFHRQNKSEKNSDSESRLMQPVPAELLLLETLFSKREGSGNEKGVGSVDIEGLKKMPPGLISPNDSFSVPTIGAKETVSVTAEEGELNMKRKKTDTTEIEGLKIMAPGLITPNDSFSFLPIGAEEALSVSADEGEPARERKRSRSRSVTPAVVEPLKS